MQTLNEICQIIQIELGSTMTCFIKNSRKFKDDNLYLLSTANSLMGEAELHAYGYTLKINFKRYNVTSLLFLPFLFSTPEPSNQEKIVWTNFSAFENPSWITLIDNHYWILFELSSHGTKLHNL